MLLNPARIVIGGGISKAGDALFVPLRAELRRQITSWSRARIDVVPAELGDDSVLWGARALAQQNYMTFAEQYKTELFRRSTRSTLHKVDQAIEWFSEARAEASTIFVCGNGGSASTASHFACDIVKGASYNRDSRFRIMALTDSLPTMTAYSNDVSYDCVFCEQLKNFAKPGDLVMAHQRLGQLSQRAPCHGVCELHRLQDDRAHRAGRRQTRSARESEYSGARAAYGPHRRCAHDRLPHDRLLLHGY